MAIVAQGQISIVDLHDMPPVQAHLDANKSKIFIKNRSGVTSPTVSTGDPLLITAELYESGSNTNLFSVASGKGNNGSITGITWEIRQGSTIVPSSEYSSKGISLVTPTNYYANSQLKITNVATLDPNITIAAIIDYKYIGMDNATPINVDIDFSTVYHGTDGLDALTVSFSNTAHVFPLDTNGYLVPNVSTTIDVKVYSGANIVKNYTLSKGSHSNLFTVSIGAVNQTTGVATITVAVNNSVAYNVRATGMPSTQGGVIPFTISYSGKTIDETFSWAVTSKGANGNDATSYWMVPSATRITYSPDATSGNYAYSPSSINLEAKQQNGTNPITSMTGSVFKYTIYNSSGVAGTEQTGATISSIPANSTKIDVKLFNASGVLVDFETIQIVKVEKDPVTVALSSDTREVRNQDGVANITFMVYRNGADVSSSSTVSWKKNGVAVSGNSTNKLSVTGASITNFVRVDASVTIQGQAYSDSISIIDISDPIMLQILSSQGEQFVNGNVNTTLKADVWRNGLKIDEAGTTYNYTWKKLKSDGTQDTTFGTNGVKTGKSIPVTSSEVTRKAIFICELSSK